MTEEKVIEKLLDFGLTKDMSEIYMFLLRAGPCPARVVAQNYGFNRMKTYRILKTLEDNGLIEVTMERPVKFVAAPLKETLDRHIGELKSNISSLEKSKKKIIEDWENLYKIEKPIEKPRFRIIQGREQIYDFLIQMCGKAKMEVCLLTTRNDLNRLSFSDIDDKLKDLNRKGINIKIITNVDRPGLNVIENYLDFAEARHIAMNTSVRSVIIDASDVLTTVDMEDSMSMTTKNDTGLWTNAPSYIKTMKAFFEALWKAAPNAKEVVDALKTGRTIEEMRIIGTQEEYAQAYKDMVDSSSEEIIIMIKQISNLPLTLQDLKAASERMIKIKILTQIDLDEVYKIKPFMKVAQVMHNLIETNLELIIMDQKEVLLNAPYRGGMGQFIWSNLKPYVLTLNQVFEEHWGDSATAEEILPKLMVQQVVTESLKLVKKALKTDGWAVVVPGELVGELGIKHSFDLIAKHADWPDKPMVIDLLIDGQASNMIIALSAKSLDAKPGVMFLASTKPFDEGEVKLAELYGIKLAYSSEAKELAYKITDEISTIYK